MQYFLKTCVYYSGDPEGLFRRNAGSVFSYEYAVNGTQAQSTEEIDLSGIRESERDFIKSAYREQIAPWIQNSILVDNELKAGIMAGRSDQKTQKKTHPGSFCCQGVTAKGKDLSAVIFPDQLQFYRYFPR